MWGWARQAEASVLWDNIGHDNKTGTFSYLSKDLALSFSHGTRCLFPYLKNENLKDQNSVGELLCLGFLLEKSVMIQSGRDWQNRIVHLRLFGQSSSSNVACLCYTDVRLHNATQCRACRGSATSDKCMLLCMTSCPTFWSIRVTSV